jgi:hypothetical protein
MAQMEEVESVRTCRKTKCRFIVLINLMVFDVMCFYTLFINCRLTDVMCNAYMVTAKTCMNSVNLQLTYVTYIKALKAL